ncbi:MAG: hypothetical protein HS105_00735 [Chloracidobacterium sp.]|nr:hypothetical protein [Chloracidobacterium sp.]MCC6825266.1 hypothetical protein [Acidobacteriota bacterium]MCO5332536.1 hypothetical protein [Pyrinomonadaceae bacterium]
MKKARIVILEGTWWNTHEVPLVLPYFHALEISHREIDISHRTFRNADDVSYYVSRIPKNSGVFLYFACHGVDSELKPAGERSRISWEALQEVLSSAKDGAISFIHFGCCEMVRSGARRETLEPLLDISGAKWVSGYTNEIGWLESMLLDLALVSQVFVPFSWASDGRTAQLKRRATKFVENYEHLARQLGFSALCRLTNKDLLIPSRLHS